MGEPMQRAATIQPLSELINPQDGLHLSPGGEIVYAREIFAKLCELGWIEA
jgi:hypothetical protein